MTWWAAIGIAVSALALAARKPREWTPAELKAMREWEQRKVGEGVCPHAGLPLGQDEDGRFRCRICDCSGWAAEEVGRGGSGAGS